MVKTTGFAFFLVLVATSGVSYADVDYYVLEATYHEGWWDTGGGDLNGGVENLPDFWSLEIIADPTVAAPFDLEILWVKITTPSDVVYDTAGSAPNPGLPFNFTPITVEGVIPFWSVQDNQDDLLIGFFNADPFNTVGDRLAYSIDVDDSNAVVYGAPSDSGGSIGGGAASGALVEVTYMANGTQTTASGYFHGDGPADAVATVNLTPVPVPSALLLGAMGLGMVGWMKRRKQQA